MSIHQETTLSTEFDRQVERLIELGYPQLAGLSTEDFATQVMPLRERLAGLSLAEPRDGYLPFVLVISTARISIKQMMALVRRRGKPGLVRLYPVEASQFAPIEQVQIPEVKAYLLVDIDRGKETINLAPKQALTRILAQQRSPLTLEEGLAILTHYPEFLQKNNCFSLLASRCGDKRVPALWLSEGAPKLGWCWDGNPHTWLGSASCARRIA